jgi:hypothetical protein
MKRRERALLVELLRCAADNDQRARCGLVGLFGAPHFGDATHRAAWKVLDSFTWPAQDWTASGVDEGYRHALLEAAARVEEGWAP